MDRRSFIVRGFAPVALATLGGPRPGDIVIVQPGHYLLFVDDHIMDTAEFVTGAQLPEGCVVNVIPLKLGPHQTIDDAVRLYKMENP